MNICVVPVDVYICMHVSMYICVHMCGGIYMDVHICKHVQSCVPACLWTYLRACMCSEGVKMGAEAGGPEIEHQGCGCSRRAD